MAVGGVVLWGVAHGGGEIDALAVCGAVGDDGGDVHCVETRDDGVGGLPHRGGHPGWERLSALQKGLSSLAAGEQQRVW